MNERTATVAYATSILAHKAQLTCFFGMVGKGCGLVKLLFPRLVFFSPSCGATRCASGMDVKKRDDDQEIQTMVPLPNSAGGETTQRGGFIYPMRGDASPKFRASCGVALQVVTPFPRVETFYAPESFSCEAHGHPTLHSERIVGKPVENLECG